MNALFNAGFDWLMRLFRTENPWPGLLAVALLTSVLVLLIFRVTSNPPTVCRRRDRLLARVLELVLFQHDLVVNLGAFGRVLVANAQYLGTLLLPLALSLVPVTLILVQAFAWFGLRPLQPGETTLLTVQFSPNAPLSQQEARVATSDGLTVEAMPVHVPSCQEISWRIRAGEGGAEWAEITAGGQTHRKSIGVGRTLAAVSAQRRAGGFWSSLTNPRERPLPPGSALDRVAVAYPVRAIRVGGREVNWLVAFFVLTMVFGLALKKPLGVEL